MLNQNTIVLSLHITLSLLETFVWHVRKLSRTPTPNPTLLHLILTTLQAVTALLLVAPPRPGNRYYTQPTFARETYQLMALARLALTYHGFVHVSADYYDAIVKVLKVFL